MARQPRIHLPGGLYHVILRGNDRRILFLDDADRLAFLRLTGEGIARYGYLVHAYCLMPNHVHLAVESGDIAIARGIHNLAFRYARRFNWRYSHVGHVFQGRYKALLVDRDRYALALIRYIHLNPVRARLVINAASYAWSSLAAYMGRAPVNWLTTHWVMELFGNESAEAARRLAEFVNGSIDAQENEVLRWGMNDERIVGDADFTRRVLGVPAGETRRLQFVDVIDAVCSAYGLTPQELAGSGQRRDASEARAFAALFALRSRTTTLTEVARYFGRDLSTISALLRRLLDRASKNAELKARINRIDTLLGSGLRDC